MTYLLLNKLITEFKSTMKKGTTNFKGKAIQSEGRNLLWRYLHVGNFVLRKKVFWKKIYFSRISPRKTGLVHDSALFDVQISSDWSFLQAPFSLLLLNTQKGTCLLAENGLPWQAWKFISRADGKGRPFLYTLYLSV